MYTQEFREQAVQLIETEKLTIEEGAKRLSMSKETLRHCCQITLIRCEILSVATYSHAAHYPLVNAPYSGLLEYFQSSKHVESS